MTDTKLEDITITSFQSRDVRFPVSQLAGIVSDILTSNVDFS